MRGADTVVTNGKPYGQSRKEQIRVQVVGTFNEGHSQEEKGARHEVSDINGPRKVQTRQQKRQDPESDDGYYRKKNIHARTNH